jgi:hypothetical protein
MIHDTIPESTENTNPDISLSSDGKIIDRIIADLKISIDQLHNSFSKAKDLILELARRLDETKRCEQSQICRKIKEVLQDKIKEGKITEKWIEGCLPPEYKRRYDKSEVSSLSKQAKRNAESEQQLKNKDIIAVDAQSGKSVLTNVDSHNGNGDGDDADDSNLHNMDEIEQGPNKEIANQNTAFEDYDEYEALRLENNELRQAVRKQTCLVTADQISATEIEFSIPKAKYEEVKAAMKSSRDSISVTFDKSGILQCADSDILREKLNDW